MPATTPQTALVIDDLSRRFGRRWAVARFKLALDPTDTVMITGANGSGKTTILRCLATALKPDHGRILLGGEDLWRHRRRLRRDIAFLSHASRLYEDLSAADNLRVWARLGAYPARPAELLDRVGLPTDRSEPVRTFSAGMRRRLALALVLLKQPRMLLLDEPFSALDPVGRQLVVDIVREVTAARPTMLLIASHLPQVGLQLCERSVHMEDGQIIWRGAAVDSPALPGSKR